MVFIEIAYFITAVLFIVGLQRMSSPKTARSGVVWAGAAMLLATVATLFWPGMANFTYMGAAIVLGGGLAAIAGRRVAMTNMPQMVAIYNGMGGGAAGAIAAVELLGVAAVATLAEGEAVEVMSPTLLVLAILGGLIGAISFSGSMLAFAKLQGLVSERPVVFNNQQTINMVILALAVVAGIIIVFFTQSWLIALFFLLALAFGVLMTLPIGGADMPVVISLYNALTGLAVAFEGFALGNAAMIVAGTVVGAAGTMLTQLMARAMNRSLTGVLFSAFGQGETGPAGEITGSMKEIDIDDAAITLGYANQVIIVPGYGMALAQAQHKVRELADVLSSRGVNVKFAIHPVAGRMPGHMNVLLAEAGVDYEKLFDLEEINPEFPLADVALIIGANDVVNPAAARPGSPLFGMPILDAKAAKNVFVIKRGKGKGFAGVENELFYLDHTRMLYGDAQEVAAKLVQAVKQV